MRQNSTLIVTKTKLIKKKETFTLSLIQNDKEQKYATKTKKRNYYHSFFTSRPITFFQPFFQIITSFFFFKSISPSYNSNIFSSLQKKSTNSVAFFRQLCTHYPPLKFEKKESISVQGYPKQNFYLKSQSPRKKNSFFGKIKMFSIKEEKWSNKFGLNLWC